MVVASAISKASTTRRCASSSSSSPSPTSITLVAASLVGYGTARAALNPVERYRVAAEKADGATVLPVDPGKDDEVTRLGHTFNALLDRIRRANERERQFLADASHELRSPLALMRTELEMALLKPRDPVETRTAFESMRGQVERLITLSNALLDLEELRASGDRARRARRPRSTHRRGHRPLPGRSGRRRSDHRGAGRARAQRRRQRALARPRPGQPRLQRAALRRRHDHRDRPSSTGPGPGSWSATKDPGFPTSSSRRRSTVSPAPRPAAAVAAPGSDWPWSRPSARPTAAPPPCRDTQVSLYLERPITEHVSVRPDRLARGTARDTSGSPRHRANHCRLPSHASFRATRSLGPRTSAPRAGG